MEVRGSSVNWVILVLLTQLMVATVNPVYGAPTTTAIKPIIELDIKNGDGLGLEYLTDEVLNEKTVTPDLTIWDGANEAVRFYELNKTTQWTRAFEYEVILKDVPKSNVFNFRIDTAGLKYYFQPPLKPEDFPKRYRVNDTHALDERGEVVDERPENVVNSYAVYDTDTGRKVFHIYRIKVMDAVGLEIYAELNISPKNGLMTITVDRVFLDSAKYPVVIDPTFGKTDKGGSNFYNQNNVNTVIFNITEDMAINNITIYLNKATGTTDVKCGLYLPNIATGRAGAHLEETDELIGWNGDGWLTFNFSDPYYYNNRTIYFNNEKTICLAWWASVNVRVYYDAGTYSKQWTRDSWSYLNAYWIDPFAPDAWANRIVSIYASYTPIPSGAPGATVYVDGVNWLPIALILGLAMVLLTSKVKG